MRHMAAALVSGLLIACCCPAAAAEESRVRWWPFGDKAEESVAAGDPFVANSAATNAPRLATQQVPSSTIPQTTAAPSTATVAPHQPAPLTDYSTDEYPERRWMIQSPLARVSWPRIHIPEMPRLPRPRLWPQKSEVDEARNAWVQTNPDSARPSPLQAVKQSAQRVRESTRSAWHKTVDVLTPGESPRSDSSRIARRETQPPFWKRMFTVEEPEQGPRTVTEWMAQDRLDP